MRGDMEEGGGGGGRGKEGRREGEREGYVRTYVYTRSYVKEERGEKEGEREGGRGGERMREKVNRVGRERERERERLFFAKSENNHIVMALFHLSLHFLHFCPRYHGSIFVKFSPSPRPSFTLGRSSWLGSLTFSSSKVEHGLSLSYVSVHYTPWRGKSTC